MWTMKCDMSKEKLMDIITKASFAMDDVKLFLDTHPNCMEAILSQGEGNAGRGVGNVHPQFWTSFGI